MLLTPLGTAETACKIDVGVIASANEMTKDPATIGLSWAYEGTCRRPRGGGCAENNADGPVPATPLSHVSRSIPIIKALVTVIPSIYFIC